MQIMKPSRMSWSLSGRALCLLLAVAATFTPTRVLSQNSSSAINGVVTDPRDAVIAGVRVTLRNVDTNVERMTVSNAAGDYFFSSVPPDRGIPQLGLFGATIASPYSGHSGGCKASVAVQEPGETGNAEHHEGWLRLALT